MCVYSISHIIVLFHHLGLKQTRVSIFFLPHITITFFQSADNHSHRYHTFCFPPAFNLDSHVTLPSFLFSQRSTLTRIHHILSVLSTHPFILFFRFFWRGGEVVLIGSSGPGGGGQLPPGSGARHGLAGVDHHPMDVALQLGPVRQPGARLCQGTRITLWGGVRM